MRDKIFLLIFLFFAGCQSDEKELTVEFQYDPEGYIWLLNEPDIVNRFFLMNPNSDTVNVNLICDVFYDGQRCGTVEFDLYHIPTGQKQVSFSGICGFRLRPYKIKVEKS